MIYSNIDPRIDEIIKELLPEKDENGKTIEYGSIKEDLEKVKYTQNSYIMKFRDYGIVGEKLNSDYEQWKKKYRQGAQTFANYALFVESRKIRNEAVRNWATTSEPRQK